MTLSNLAIVAGEQLADYNFGDEHPFGPQRHQAFLDGMLSAGLSRQVTWLDPVLCQQDDLLSFHTQEYIKNIQQCSIRGNGYLDQGDTPARKGIYEAACTVVGSVIDVVDRVMQKQYRRGFIPIAGLHHSYKDHCSGFCVFNDCAIAIERLRHQYQLEKILYVDIDAHHGDGVFYNYESNAHLFIVDIHEDGQFLYPGTGDVDETGTGPAAGSKLNIPLPMHADDRIFSKLWPVAEKFIRSIKPDFIIFQCGADSMQGDPITHLELSEQSYRLAANSLSNIADEYCDGRMVALGGGGYNMQNISRCWPEVVRSML